MLRLNKHSGSELRYLKFLLGELKLELGYLDFVRERNDLLLNGLSYLNRLMHWCRNLYRLCGFTSLLDQYIRFVYKPVIQFLRSTIR